MRRRAEPSTEPVEGTVVCVSGFLVGDGSPRGRLVRPGAIFKRSDPIVHSHPQQFRDALTKAPLEAA